MLYKLHKRFSNMIYFRSVTFSEQILRLTIKVFVTDAERKTGKWRRVFVNISVCLLASHPNPKCHFHLRATGFGFRTYEDTKWYGIFSNLKIFYWVDMSISYFVFVCTGIFTTLILSPK